MKFNVAKIRTFLEKSKHFVNYFKKVGKILVYIELFSYICNVFRKECKTYLLDSHTITTVGIRAKQMLSELPRLGADFPYTFGFVVNRVAYGEGLRLLYLSIITKTI